MFFLGFMLALAAYYYLAKFTVKAVAKRYPSNLARYVTIGAFVLIPVWDIVPGQLYFRYLCEKDGGVKVYRTVELDRAYFLADGQPDQEQLRRLYDRVSKDDRDFSSIFHITKTQLSILDKLTGEHLGTATDFWYYGGWVNATLFPLGSSSTCPEYPNHSVYNSLWQRVIRPHSGSPAGGK